LCTCGARRPAIGAAAYRAGNVIASRLTYEMIAERGREMWSALND
jgi:hypothetical protein